MNWLIIKIIGFYQYFISPWFGKNCLYHPTCSSYATEAFKRYNFIIATLLTIWRLLRCNPFSRGGYDPVPKQIWGAKKK